MENFVFMCKQLISLAFLYDLCYLGTWLYIKGGDQRSALSHM
jgi:hypothetical protein